MDIFSKKLKISEEFFQLNWEKKLGLFVKYVLGKCCLFRCMKNILSNNIMLGLAKSIQENTASRKQRTCQEKH